MKELETGYLWDGSGEPDPEVVRLENALARFRHDGRMPEWSEAEAVHAAEKRHPWFHVAAVAASALLIASGWLGLRVPADGPTASPGSWGVESVAGNPKIGTKMVGTSGEKARLRPGQLLETDGNSQASLTVEAVGQVDVEPKTRLRLMEARESRTWMKLERGTIHAFIWAPAGQFMVDTPGALAVDLGCRYTLHVDDDGKGLLRTTMGWVGFKLNGREAFIPQGAVDETRPGVGPGTPFFEDAAPEFLSTLKRFDFDEQGAELRSAELRTILAKARKRDALTLWHLLSRVDGSDRGRVFDVLNGFVPAPKGVTRDGIVRGEPAMLDVWWNELGFDDIAVWRTWERAEIENTHRTKLPPPLAR